MKNKSEHKTQISILVFFLLITQIYISGNNVANKIKEFKFTSENHKLIKLSLLNDRNILMGIDESKGTGKDFDTVCVDLNFNEDLNDDTKYSFAKNKQADIDFNINDINYKLSIKNATRCAGGINIKIEPLHFISIFSMATISTKGKTWQYVGIFFIYPDTRLKKYELIDILSMNVKLAPNIAVDKERKEITINLDILNKSGRKSRPVIKRNGEDILPTLTVKDSKQNVIEKGKFGIQ